MIPSGSSSLWTVSQIEALSIADITLLTSVQIADLSAAAFGALSPSQIAALSMAQIQATSWANWESVLTVVQISSFTPKQVSEMNAGQITALSRSQFSTLTAAQIGGLSATQIQAITWDNWEYVLAPAQIGGFSAQQVSDMSAGQITALSRAQFSALSAAQIAGLSATQIQAITWDNWEYALTPAQIGGFSAQQVSDMSAGQIAALNRAQFSALSAAQIAGLSATQIRAITWDNWENALTVQQVAGFGVQQISAMSAAQLDALNAAQFSALNTGLTLTPTGVSYQELMAVLSNFESQIGSSGLTATQLSSLQKMSAVVEAVDGSQSYESSILNSMVDGVSKGEAGLGVGMSQAAYSSLYDQWFLGTDNPSPISGDPLVSNSGPLFSSNSSSHLMGAGLSQGYYNGDCWLVASLVATADADPSLIKSMISENSNGTYAVRLYNTNTDSVGWVTVDNELPTFTGVTDSDKSIWGGLIEKAYIEAQSDGIANPKAGIGQNSYIANEGGNQEALNAFTGTNNSIINQMAALGTGGPNYQEISSALADQESVIFASYSATNYGLEGGHMFAVIGIDATNGNYIFQNPYRSPSFEVTAAELSGLAGTGDYFAIGNKAGPGSSNYGSLLA